MQDEYLCDCDERREGRLRFLSLLKVAVDNEQSACEMFSGKREIQLNMGEELYLYAESFLW
jgi:hypothetical protein